MDRRKFLSATGLGAVALGTVSSAAEAAPKKAASTAKGGPAKFKLGCQSPPATDEHFAFFARYGVRNCSSSAKITDPAGSIRPSMS
jgi:mannonate dehydratase